MRVHSNTLEYADIYRATKDLPGVYVTASQHGSRSHARAFEVSLEGNGFHKNSGTGGASYEFGATWDEWGAFIAAIYEVDPGALFGSVKYPVYPNAYEFHGMYQDRFANGLPADTHKRHTWEITNRLDRKCKKCSAVWLCTF